MPSGEEEVNSKGAFVNQGMCTNNLYIPQEELESALLAKFKDDLLQPESVAYVVEEFGDLARLFDLRGAARQIKTEGGIILSSYVLHRDCAQVGDIRKAWSTACVEAGSGRF